MRDGLPCIDREIRHLMHRSDRYYRHKTRSGRPTDQKKFLEYKHLVRHVSERAYERFIDEVSQKSYGNKSLVEEVNESNRILIQEKEQAKNQALCSEYEKLFVEYLSKDPDKWPVKDEVESQLKACKAERRRVRQELEEEKDRIAEALQPVVEEFASLQKTVTVLKDKLTILENKKSDFETKRHIDPETVDVAVEKCQKCIENVETEIEKKNQTLENLKSSIADLKSQLSSGNQHKVRKQRGPRHGTPTFESADRAKTVLSFLESSTNVHVQTVDSDTIQLQFLNGSEDLNLILTLTLKEGHSGKSLLTDVKANVPEFNIDDITAVAMETNDIPYLVRKTQERWQQHFPVLSEMNILIKEHAVDWMQNEHKLRVLSKCGKIMFTLNIPKDYPNSRDITLDKVVGLDDITDLELPQPPAGLLQWVEFLEEKYGNS